MAPLPPPPPPPPKLPPPPPPLRAATELPLGGHTYDVERSRWGLGDAFLAFGIFIVVGLVLAAIFFGTEGRDATLSGVWLPLLVVGPAVCKFSYVIWVGQKKGTGIVADFRAQIRFGDAAVGAALCISALILAGITAQIMIEITGDTPNASVAELIEDSEGESSGLTVWIFLMAFLGATFIPIAEELLFRGLWWSALEKRGVHQLVSLAITSTVFAIVHFEPSRTPVLLVLGAVIGLGRIATGRIGASIFAHMYVNAIGMTFLLIELS